MGGAKTISYNDQTISFTANITNCLVMVTNSFSQPTQHFRIKTNSFSSQTMKLLTNYFLKLFCEVLNSSLQIAVRN